MWIKYPTRRTDLSVMGEVVQSLRGVRLGDWVLEVVLPSLVLGWGLWIWNWFGIWLGMCGLLYFALRALVYPARQMSHSEYGRLLPGVGALCVAGCFSGFSWTLIVLDGATDAVVLGVLLALCALPFAFLAVVSLSAGVARRFGMAPDGPVVDLEPGDWPDPPSVSGVGWG